MVFTVNHRNSYPRFYISKKVCLGESEISGTGVFAAEKIKRNELIESSPVITYWPNCHKLWTDMYEARHILQEYVFGWPDGMVAIVLGYGSMYNHARNCNVKWVANEKLKCMEYYAVKDIEEGDELLIRYGKDESRLWFVNSSEEV